jgi:hypothetical protein
VGKKTSKTKSSSKPWKPAQPYLLGAAGTIQDTVAGNQGNLNEQAGQIRGFLPGLGEKAFGANPGLDAANGYAQDVLGGKYLDQGNPYMQGMIDQTAGDVSNRVNSMFARSGASLGTQHAGVMTKELANAENSLRYQNYGNERNAQSQAAGMIPGLTASQYAGIMPYLAAQQTAGSLPFAGIQNLGQIGGLFGGYGTQTGTQPGGWGTGLLGAAASLGSAALSNPAIFASSRDLKTDIEVLGPWDDRGDGLERVAFRYKSDPTRTRFIGVIAEQVKETRPWAYVPNFYQGKAGVNYAKLSEAA